MAYITQTFGAFKLKDKAGRQGQMISNPTGKYLVIKEIVIRKAQGENNKVFVDLVFPDPDTIEVLESDKKTESKVDSPGL